MKRRRVLKIRKEQNKDSLKIVYKGSDIITEISRHSISKPIKINLSPFKPSVVCTIDLIEDIIVPLFPYIPRNNSEYFKEKSTRIILFCSNCSFNS